MEKLALKGEWKDTTDYGPDPVMLRKTGKAPNTKKKCETYKKRIQDPEYMDYAINKIALELLHFIQK